MLKLPTALEVSSQNWGYLSPLFPLPPHLAKAQPFSDALGQQRKLCKPPILRETSQIRVSWRRVLGCLLVRVPASSPLFIDGLGGGGGTACHNPCRSRSPLPSGEWRGRAFGNDHDSILRVRLLIPEARGGHRGEKPAPSAATWQTRQSDTDSPIPL